MKEEDRLQMGRAKGPFAGTHPGFVDDTGRVCLPPEWRDALASTEIGMLLLSDGEDHRLVVYPCPGGITDVFLPEPHPAWGGLPPRGEYIHRVDPKGRFSLPGLFRERIVGAEVVAMGCQSHIVIRVTSCLQ